MTDPEKIQTISHNRSKKVAAAASVMAGISLLAAHPDRAAAEPKPHKPTPAARHHKTELQLRQEKLTRQKDEILSQQASDIALKFTGELVSVDTIEGKGLKSQESLPGAHLKITPEQQKQQEQSTVHIVLRHKGSQENWQDWCTGTKIIYKGKIYIESAGHCFKEDLLSPSVDNSGTQPAYDYLNASLFEFGIVQQLGQEPLILINGLSLDTSDDWALLRPDLSTGSEGFSAIPAIDVTANSPAPVIGEEGVIHGYAQFNQFQPTTAKVTYLGRKNVMGFDSMRHTYDIIGITQEEVDKSGCLPGFSGTSIKYANGSQSGPLTAVYDFGYKNMIQNALSPFGVNPINRYVLEQLTGIDLSKDEGACLVSVRDVDNKGRKVNTMDNLVNAFDNPVPMYGKGGDPSGGQG